LRLFLGFGLGSVVPHNGLGRLPSDPARRTTWAVIATTAGLVLGALTEGRWVMACKISFEESFVLLNNSQFSRLIEFGIEIAD
jgi:hypothetical protein